MKNTDKKSNRKIKLFPDHREMEKKFLNWVKCKVCGHFYLYPDIKNWICNRCEEKQNKDKECIVEDKTDDQ